MARKEPVVSVEQQGAAIAAEHVHAMHEAAADARPFFRDVQDALAKAEQRWFASEGRGAWPPLSETTRAIKRARGLDNGVMVATGALRASLIVGSGARSRRVSRTIMHFGTSVYYANFHAHTRPVLIPMDAKANDLVLGKLRKYLIEPTKRRLVE